METEGSKRRMYFVRSVGPKGPDGQRFLESEVDLKAPEILMMSYAQTMVDMIPRALKPKTILVLGLGGGALVSYLQHRYPEANIDVVELNQTVIDLAYRFFHFKPTNRCSVIHDDAHSFVLQSDQRYDIILVDVFGLPQPTKTDSTGVPLNMKSQTFLRKLNQLSNCIIFNLNESPTVEKDIQLIGEECRGLINVKTDGINRLVSCCASPS